MDNLPTKEEFSLFATIFNYILNGLIGLIVAIWYVSEQKNKLQNTLKENQDSNNSRDEKIKKLEAIIFTEKEGLNVLTLGAHQKQCEINQEFFSKDYEAIFTELKTVKEDVSELKDKLDSVNHEAYFKSIELNLKKINENLKMAYNHDRRKPLRELGEE